MELVADQRELRVLANLDLKTVRLSSLVAAERHRDHETMGSAQWMDRSREAGALVGEPIMPSLGTKIVRALGHDPELELLALSLLQLTPTFVQCTAALADRFYGRGAAREGGGGSTLMSMGGYTDSCYMWRSDSPLLQIRNRANRS